MDEFLLKRKAAQRKHESARNGAFDRIPWKDTPVQHDALHDLKKVGDQVVAKEITYTGYSFTEGMKYAEKVHSIGGCSAACFGDFVVRNLDWYYDHHVSTIVRVKAAPGRNASISTSTGRILDTDTDPEFLRVLPMFVVDGVNEHGLFTCALVHYYGDFAPCVGTNPGHPRVCANMVNRLVLDTCSTVDEAIAVLKMVDLYAPSDGEGHNYHWLMRDKTRCVIIELVDNTLTVTNKTVVTNFPRYCDYNDLPSNTHPAGVERLNILASANVTDLASVKAVAESVYYSKAYAQDTAWYSEVTGEYATADITKEDVDSQSDIIVYALNLMKENAQGTTRDKGDTWNTNHSVIYNVNDITKLYYDFQESKEWCTISTQL